MLLNLTLSAMLVVAATAQDTYRCPDGWDKQEDQDACRWAVIGGDRVTWPWISPLIGPGASSSAAARPSPRRTRRFSVPFITELGWRKLIVQVGGRSGPCPLCRVISPRVTAWFVHFIQSGINYWLKDKLLTLTEVGATFQQYWLGAYTEVTTFRLLWH